MKKQNPFKKVSSILLCLCMLMQYAPVAALAASAEPGNVVESYDFDDGSNDGFNRTYNDNGCDEHDVLPCQGGTCSKCGDEIEGFGCQNHDTPACTDGKCYYCGGFVSGFGHENGAWYPCTSGECVYGCGLQYPATGEHDLEGTACEGGLCWQCWEDIAPQHTYDNGCDAECNECGDIRTGVGHQYDNDNDVSCNICGDIRGVDCDHVYDIGCSDLDCNTCGEYRITGHTLTYHEAKVPANCQEQGYDEYWTCGELIYGYGEHDVLPCQGGTCSKCGNEFEGYGCDYNTGDEEVPLPLCQPGECVYCGTYYEKIYDCENTSGAPCSVDGECAYGCGKQFSATGEHDLEGTACEGGLCWQCWEDIAPRHTYNNGCDAECNECGDIREVGDHADEDGDQLCDACFRNLAPAGSQRNPIALSGARKSVTIPGGTTHNFIGRYANGVLKVTGSDFTVTADGQNYTPVDGVVSVAVGSNFRTFNVAITNNSAEEAVFIIEFILPLGSENNPAQAKLGDNAVSVAANSQGYYLKYIAQKDGNLLIAISGEENWSYRVNNITANVYGDTQWSDYSAPNPCEIETAVGDELEIIINGYDPYDPWTTPAAEYSVNLVYEGDENCEHVYDDNRDSVCNVCGIYREVSEVVPEFVTITVDGITYGIGETAIITPETESVVFTVTGQNFQKMEDENYQEDYYIFIATSEFGDSLNGDGWTCSADGKTITKDYDQNDFVYAIYPFEVTFGAGIGTGVKVHYKNIVPDTTNEIVIQMLDTCGNSWNDAGIEVYKNGVLEEIVSVDEYENMVSYNYNSEQDYYVFKWVEGDYDSECIFWICVNGEEQVVAFGNDCTSGQVILTLGTPIPQIIEQPTDVKAPYNELASTTVKAEGEDLTYQWYYSDNGKTFKKSIYTGDTYSLYMYKGRNGRQIYCVITDAAGRTVTTETVTLSIDPQVGVEIMSQPTDASAAYNQAAVTTVEATGDGLTYQWYYSDNGTDFKKSVYKEDTYTLNMYKGRDGRQVYCVITDAYGNTVTTDIATLSIQPKNGVQIISQPTDASAAYNQAAVTTVEATGDGLTYQWYYSDNGTDFKKSVYKEDTYTLNMYKGRDGRQVYCVITDAYGNTVTTDIATLSIQPKNGVQIISQPTDASAVYDELAVTRVEAEGDGLTYQWYYKDQGKENFKKSIYKEDTYTLQMYGSRNGREVYCVITDAYGNTVTTEIATLTISE